MVTSNLVSGVDRSSVLCESLESRSMFAAVGIDKTFGGTGRVVTTFGNGYETAEAVVSLKDGRVAAAGYGEFSDGSHMLLAVYNANGTLSTSFDKDGKLSLSASTTAKLSKYGDVSDLVQMPDGGLLVVGTEGAIKIKLDGTVDASYGSGGRIALLDGPDPVMLSNGALRQVGLGNEGQTIFLRDLDAKGRQTKSIRRTTGVVMSRVTVDANAVTAVGGTKVYRFSAANLAKSSSFGTGGVYDLTPAFRAWAKNNGPFDATGDESEETTPVDKLEFGIGRFYESKSGIGVRGAMNYSTPKVPTSGDPGLEQRGYTELVFDVSLTGKSAKVFGGPGLPASVVARPVYEPEENEEGFTGDGTFYTPAGARTFDVFNDDTRLEASGAAADGKFYLAGSVYGGLSNTDDDRHFTVVRTLKV